MTYLYADNKCVAVIPDADDYDPPLWMDTNCKQCGAPMHANQNICLYCLSKRKLKSNIRIIKTTSSDLHFCPTCMSRIDLIDNFCRFCGQQLRVKGAIQFER